MKKNFFKNNLILILIILLMLQRAIGEYIPAFSYLDEVVTLILIVMYLIKIIKKKSILKADLIIISLITAMMCCGLLSNFISGYNRKVSSIITGIIVWFKAFITFMCAYTYFDNDVYNTNTIVKILAKVTKLIVIIAFGGLIISHFTHWGIENHSALMRYGIHPYKFIYPQAAILSWYCIAYMMILTLDNAIEKKKSNIFYLIVTSIIWAFTLRSRAFVYILCYWMFYFWILKTNKNEIPKIKIKNIILIGCIAMIVAMPAIQKYFFNESTSRALLLRTGLEISRKYFPLGAGFANFATSASYKEYSALYYEYGFNLIYALKEGSNGSTELTDCYWPAVIGEMGIIGLILMILLLFNIGKKLINKSKNNKWSYLCALFMIATSLFSSIVTGVFSSDIMIAYVIIVCLACNISSTEKNKENKNE